MTDPETTAKDIYSVRVLRPPDRAPHRRRPEPQLLASADRANWPGLAPAASVRFIDTNSTSSATDASLILTASGQFAFCICM